METQKDQSQPFYLNPQTSKLLRLTECELHLGTVSGRKPALQRWEVEPCLSQGSLDCLVLSREWGKDYGDYYWGLYKDYYYRDPFPNSLLSTKQLS